MDTFGREKQLLLRGVVAGTGAGAVFEAWLGYTRLDVWLLAAAAVMGLTSLFTLTLARTRQSGGFWALTVTMLLIATTYPGLGIGEDAVWHTVVMILFVGALMISPRDAWSDGMWLIAAIVITHSAGHLVAGSGFEIGESLAMGGVAVGAAWLVSRMRGRLEASAERFRAVLDGAPVAIWQEDFSAVHRYLESLDKAVGLTRVQMLEAASHIRVLAVNRAAVELVEAASESQLLGPLNAAGITEDTFASLAAQVEAVREKRTFLEVDVVGSTMKGNPFEGILYWTAPKTEDGPDYTHVTVAMTDVSRLRETERRLGETIRVKDRFVAAVSHEIRTPLASVIGLTSEVADRYDSFSDGERRELCGLVSAEANEANAIVEDLLVAARAESGNVSINPAVFDVVEMVEELVESFAPTPLLELPGETLEAVADPLRVRQILRNLLTNARRYGGSRVALAVRSLGPTLSIEVRDDGDGVPVGTEQMIFEAYKAADEGSRAAGSIGLGLYVSRQLAELMDGRLEYLRVDGETVFRLTLPVVDALSEAEVPSSLSAS